LGTFYATRTHGHVLYGERQFHSVTDWLLTIRAEKWNQHFGKATPIDDITIAGHFDGPWWRQVEVLRDKEWLPVEKV
jgi:hypothetical protein